MEIDQDSLKIILLEKNVSSFDNDIELLEKYNLVK